MHTVDARPPQPSPKEGGSKAGPGILWLAAVLLCTTAHAERYAVLVGVSQLAYQPRPAGSKASPSPMTVQRAKRWC